MKIALCEDEQKYIKSLSEIISAYHTPEGNAITWDIFDNAMDLVDSAKKTEYDAILLDIILPGLSGMDAARDIRRMNKSVPIVFMTNSREFAVESYRVHAFDYLMKPISRDDIFRVLNDIYGLRRSQKQDGFAVTFAKGAYVIEYDQLIFLEIKGHTLSFHLMDGSSREIKGKISDCEDFLLCRKNFIKVHRSYIINMEHMNAYERNSFTAITGENIPISRNVAKYVQNRYMDFLHTRIRLG